MVCRWEVLWRPYFIFHLLRWQLSWTMSLILLHLLLTGNFFTHLLMSVKLATMSAYKYMRVIREMILAIFRFNQETYASLMEYFMYQEAAKVYMFHLVECIILAYKSRVYINERCVSLCIDHGFHSWAQGCVVLTLLYRVFEDATIFETRQFVGYMT